MAAQRGVFRQRQFDPALQLAKRERRDDRSETVIEVGEDGEFPVADNCRTLPFALYSHMKRGLVDRLLSSERCNFILTNRVPRRLLTRIVGGISKSEHPWVKRASMALWHAFADIDLSDAATRDFRSMHDCFTRRLRAGARPIDANPRSVTSPCDAIVGACGPIDDLTLVQAKQHTYTVAELVGDTTLAATFRNGCYATLRLTSGMYHRFHAPYDGTIERVTYISGDVWNVNPAAVKRIPKLFCENERAVLELRLANTGPTVALVPVAAILVASIRLHFLDVLLHLRYRGPHVLDCDAKVAKGDELGWFEHGSTIIVLAPEGFRLADDVTSGAPIRMGRPLMLSSETARVR